MSSTVEKIVISVEGIDVISSQDNVNNVVQLDLIPPENDKENIWEKYNLNTINNFPFDMMIVRALSSNKEQLTDYLETCRRANYSKGKVEIPATIPQIEYDLRDLKKSELPIATKIDIYEQSKQTKSVLKDTKTKMNIIDRAYFAVQELLSKSRKNNIPVLSEGNKIEQLGEQRNLREELKVELIQPVTQIIHAGEHELNQEEQKNDKQDEQER